MVQQHGQPDSTQLHARAIWNYALAEGKAYGSDANFENFEKTDYHMNTPAQTGRMLREKFAILTSTVVEKQVSEDGTVKLLVCNAASVSCLSRYDVGVDPSFVVVITVVAKFNNSVKCMPHICGLSFAPVPNLFATKDSQALKKISKT